jgi:hypothetical protein
MFCRVDVLFCGLTASPVPTLGVFYGGIGLKIAIFNIFKKWIFFSYKIEEF